MTSINYPPSPEFIATEKLNPSPAFRKQVAKVITSIILFLIVYLLLIAVAVILAIACCYLGIHLIIALPKFITLIAGLGLVAVGLSVIFFLIKFIFAVSKNENPNRIEIKEHEQPELFAFIRKLSKETKTTFPKKIFISPDVNACVFYNSSFWSMIFPVRKNLEIGLGVVNSINISELKAVIAHEFGHFSQRSMRLGIFTYNVNKIIYNMLYENNSYTSFLNAWGNLHGVLSLFALITVKIAQSIQYILRAMYQLINKNYMGLSREMEFHADAIAASAAGGNNVITGLSRIEIASGCYNTTIGKAGDFLKDKKILKNIFDGQLTVFKGVASRFRLPLKNGLPEISFEFVNSFSSSRINYKNQWASHPELKERKQHLELIDMNVAPDEAPAWEVFTGKDALKEKLTAKLYSHITETENMEVINAEEFNDQYQHEKEFYVLPLAYKGYYDSRYIETTDWNFDELESTVTTCKFDDLFTKQNAQLYSFVNNNLTDIETVKAINKKKIDVKTFDFDGEKYSRKDCDTILQKLEKDIEEKKIQLKQLDKEAFCFFNSYVKDLRPLYETYSLAEKKYNTYEEAVNTLLASLEPLYKGGLSIEEVYQRVKQIKDIHEPHLKKHLNILLKDAVITKEKNAGLFSRVNDFLQKDYRYFFNDEFKNDELNTLTTIAVNAADACNDYRFRQYKYMLDQQWNLYEASMQ